MKTITVRGVTFGQGRPKVCVPIVGKSLEEIIESADNLAGKPVDMVEWRADFFEGVMDKGELGKALRQLRSRLDGLPLLATFRTKEEGGEKEITPEEYHEFCVQVGRSGQADFIDLELSKGEKLILKIMEDIGSIHVILSSHDFQKTPKKEEIIRRLCTMQSLGCDMAKIAVMPNSRRDVLTLMEATLEMQEKWAVCPLITMSMAGKGTLTRLSGEFFGSAVTFGTVGQASAPGQIPVEDLKPVLEILHQSLAEEKQAENLYLIGFMGCGKSTVASALVKKYHLTRVEMDQEIEAQQGMKISDIFERFGENYFRQIESRFLKELGKHSGLVVSCGGGAVLKPENVERMKKDGKVILLTAKPETILERVKYDEKRPLLKGKKNVEDIRALMEARREKYEAAADIVISTDGKSVSEIAEEIMKQRDKEKETE